MANNLNLINRANEIQNSLPAPEYALGKGLLQPANNTNSGPRKIMQIIQKEQSIQLCHPETPILMTGYENQYGELSSSYIKSDGDFVVVDKIYKNPLHYWVIAFDASRMLLHTFERVSYVYVSESYGYNIDTSYLDSLSVGNPINKNAVVAKSASFDSAGNKCDGINLTTVYLACGLSTEDPVILSESAAKRFESPLFSSIQLIINDNDIPLNLYGDNENYKSFPDIGEEVKNGIVCALRRERKDDEALYCQSVQHLKELMSSDVSYIGEGQVIDIDVYCNNVENLDIVYNTQIAKYYQEKMQFSNSVVRCVSNFLNKHKGVKMSYDLAKLYDTCKKTIDGVPYIRDKVFNNIVVDIMIRRNKTLSVTDKITDRYGGKGVISAILPDEKMPMFKRGDKLIPVDAIYNSSTVVNRENPGQSFETEITFIGEKIIEAIFNKLKYISGGDTIYYDNIPVDVLKESENMIYTYLSIVSPRQGEDYKRIITTEIPSQEDRSVFLHSIIDMGTINVVSEPISGGICLEMLRKLYGTFPWIEADDCYVLQQDSNGNPRRIKTRRKLITGKKYIYRLKQTGEEKFSAVSLASTNLRGENTKTKANKQHRVPYANTPVRVGGMEVCNQMDAAGLTEEIVTKVMLLSTSPVARRLAEQLLTGNPFDINIKLDKNATSRSVEIFNAYFKTMGLRLTFTKLSNKKPQVMSVYAFDVLPAPMEEQVKYHEFISGMPYYLDYDSINELTEYYKKIHKDKLPVQIVDFVPEGVDMNTYHRDIVTESVRYRVAKLGAKADGYDELRALVEQDNPNKNKLKRIFITAPFSVIPGDDNNEQ